MQFDQEEEEGGGENWLLKELTCMCVLVVNITTLTELCPSYMTALLPAPHVEQEVQILEDLSESDDIVSEIKYFRLGFDLGIPYHLVLQNLRDAPSTNLVMTSHLLLLKTVVLRLLYFARNVYLSAGDEITHKYFYRILIPGAMYIQPSYFETIAETFNANKPYRTVGIRGTPFPPDFTVGVYGLFNSLQCTSSVLTRSGTLALPVCQQDSQPDCLVHQLWFTQSRVSLLHVTGCGVLSRRYEHTPAKLLPQHL